MFTLKVAGAYILIQAVAKIVPAIGDFINDPLGTLGIR